MTLKLRQGLQQTVNTPRLSTSLWVPCAGHLWASCTDPGAAVGRLAAAAGLADAPPPAAPQVQQRASLTYLLR